MAAGTLDNHIARIERAIALMAARLRDDQTPTLEEMASAAAMSKYHFHRVYRLLSGETCGETIQRIRLATGAHALTRPDASVTDAAMAAGYASSQAFAKALKEAVAMPASHLRADPERLAATVATLSAPSPAGDPPPLRLEIASLDPLEVFAVTTEGVYPALNDTYVSLFMAAGGPENVRAILGWPLGDFASDPAGSHVFVSGLSLAGPAAAPAPGMGVQTRDGGLFLLGRHNGSFANLLETVDTLYAAALGIPGLELRDVPPLFHYLDDPDETPEADLRTDIYLPIDPGT